MILVISTCKEKLHEFEFVKPIEDILKRSKIKFITKNYKKLSNNDILKAKKIIICGTSLKDNRYIPEIKKFIWIKDFNGSVLGICSGMQIIGLVYEGKLCKKTEIGYFFEEFKDDFLGLKGKQEVYHLHNNYIDFLKLKDFETFTKSRVSQAVKHSHKPLYGVLFHPEVRNKEMIMRFVKNG